MNPGNIIFEALEIFKLVLPFMFFGLFLASLIRLSPYFKHIGLPMSRLASTSNLSAECSTVLTMFFVNNWATLAMLSDFYRKKLVSEKEVIVTMLVGFFPKGVHVTVFFMAPIAIPVLGLSVGGVYILMELLIYLGITAVGIGLGRLWLYPQMPGEFEAGNREATAWPERLKISLKESVAQFKKIVVVLIPTVIVVLLLLDLGMLDPITEACAPLLESVGLPSSSMIVIAASLMSQMAAIGAVGTLLGSGLLSPLHCLILLFMAHFLHMGIGCIRLGLPMNISLFGRSLGLKTTLITYSMLELGTALVIFSLAGCSDRVQMVLLNNF